MRPPRLLWSIVICLLAAGSALGRQLPNIDKLGERAATPAKAAALEQKKAALNANVE